MGFIYNGISSQSMGIKARLTSWQASPPLRNSFVQIPGKAGVADFGSSGAERTITVKCNVYPQLAFSNLVGVLDGIAEWLNPDNGLKQLVLDDVPDRYFTARLTGAGPVQPGVREQWGPRATCRVGRGRATYCSGCPPIGGRSGKEFVRTIWASYLTG